MKAPHQSVALVLEAVRIHSPTAYSWFDDLVEDLPQGIAKAMDTETSRRYLRHQLQWRLYESYYCHGFPIPNAHDVTMPPARPLSPFVHRLSLANRGEGSRDPGWTIRDLGQTRIVVDRDGLHVWVREQDVFPQEGEDLATGARVCVRLPKELLALLPGFYVALGDEGLAVDDSTPLIRFYWNLCSDGAALLVSSVTAALNQERIPFRLKVVNEPERFDRCDAGVLYVRKHDYHKVVGPVAAAYRAINPTLEPETPAFTKELAPGLAFAEDPGGGKSFGAHRCFLLADALVRAHELGQKTVNERLRVIAERFEEEGLDLESPYLNAGSSDGYAPLGACR